MPAEIKICSRRIGIGSKETTWLLLFDITDTLVSEPLAK
jgi:hypothetical protein|tara:strand:- start:126 stop:242 length:117 start_codon:yes stop_codon:yes gene_type:complete